MSVSSIDSEEYERHECNNYKTSNSGQLNTYCRLRPPLTGEYEKNKKEFSYHIYPASK